jgi:hypothetical protein
MGTSKIDAFESGRVKRSGKSSKIKRSRARNLNDPQHWVAWFNACLKDEWSAKQLRLPGALAMITGQDRRALDAIAHCWRLYANSDEAGQRGALAAVRALLPAIQPRCRDFARELIPQSLDWHDRERIWPLVTDDPLTAVRRLVHESKIQPGPELPPPCEWCDQNHAKGAPCLSEKDIHADPFAPFDELEKQTWYGVPEAGPE